MVLDLLLLVEDLVLTLALCILVSQCHHLLLLFLVTTHFYLIFHLQIVLCFYSSYLLVSLSLYLSVLSALVLVLT